MILPPLQAFNFKIPMGSIGIKTHLLELATSQVFQVLLHQRISTLAVLGVEASMQRL